jgi:hypothetical protein
VRGQEKIMAVLTFSNTTLPTPTLVAEATIRHAELAAVIERSRDLCWWGHQLCAGLDPRRRTIRGASTDDAALLVTMITGVSVCLECISKRSGMPVGRVDALLTTISGNIALVVDTGGCEACLETRRTYRLATDGSNLNGEAATRPNGTRHAIRRFLGQRPGDAFCMDCISATLFPGKNIDVAMRLLEGNGVQRRNGRCSTCGKMRLVAGVPSSN